MDIGIIYALTALLGWGIADFLIEKSTRKMGDVASLFYITAFGAIVLLPLVRQDIIPFATLQNGSQQFWVLIGAGVFALVASLFDFEALRVGKIAAVEPIYAIEVIGTVVVTGLVIGEWLTPTQTALVVVTVAGVMLVSLKGFVWIKQIRLERGVLFALTAALFMTGENFLTGYGARLSNPLLANWVVDACIALSTFTYLWARGELRQLIPDIKQHWRLIFWVSLFDTVGWVGFAYSAVHLPIGLATAISEAYIALAVLLGLFVNKEKLRAHQLLGLVLCIAAAITLSYF